MEFAKQDVCKTADNIWRSALGLNLSPCESAFRLEPSDRIVSAVSFEGGFDGQVALECTRKLAGQMASIMFAVEECNLTDEDINDALREITNITAGGLKAMIPRNTRMSLPLVISNERWDESRERKALGFECEGNQLNIVVEGRGVDSEKETIKVLLIEDSRVARRMISNSLNEITSLDFQLDWCEMLGDGLAMISENEFDVVLLDLTLRDSSGLDTCLQVHQHSPTLPIVVLTSVDDESFALDALKAGAQDYLLKAEIAPTLLARSIQYAIERNRAEADRERLQQKLLDASRQAGIAEMATGILHNVGNVLNSVNLSATLINNLLKDSSIDRLQQTSQIVNLHKDNFGDFVTNSERGKLLPEIIERLATNIAGEHQELQNEVQELIDNITHIKEIVCAQQAMAKPSGLQIRIDLKELMEQALTTRKDSLENAQIEIVREYDNVPVIWADQHKVLQILGNVIKNAEESIRESGNATRKLNLRVGLSQKDDAIFAEVGDSGLGIAEGDINKLFQHGFTTKKDGHGFGLHSCANAAGELNGKLTAHSDGLGKGASFRLVLPVGEIAPAQTPV